MSRWPRASAGDGDRRGGDVRGEFEDEYSAALEGELRQVRGAVVGDRIAYAVHCMSVAGYRTVPLVDADQRPIGIVTVSDVIRWLAGLVPEAVLSSLPPGDARLKWPQDQDAG